MMDDLTIDAHPAVIDANFDQIRTQLAQELAKYDTVVTVDTVKEAKQRAAELNKLKAAIDTRRKEAVAAVSEPIRIFEEQARELASMCTDVRQRIVDQVKRFEEARLEEVRTALEAKREALYQQQGLRDEYRTADIGPMVKLTALTAKGSLTAAAERELAAAVGECLGRQQRVDLRLAQLENESHRAGLYSPLTREHVAGFLEASSDDDYASQLERLIARELERQRVAEQRERERLEREHAEQIARDARDAEALREREARLQQAEREVTTSQRHETRQDARADIADAKAAHPPAPGRRRVAVEILLEVLIPKALSDDDVKEQLMQRLAAAGIESSVQSVVTRRMDDERAAA